MSASQGNATGDCYPLFSDDTKCDVILGFRRTLGLISMLCCCGKYFSMAAEKSARGGLGTRLSTEYAPLLKDMNVVVSYSVFIVFVIILYKKYRFLSQRLILYLSIAAFFQAIGYVMGDYHIAFKARVLGHFTGLCRFQGYWVLFFDWLSFLWVGCITFNIFWNAVFLKRTEKFEKFYFIVDLAIPIIVCCFPFIGDSYGPAGLWCWISSQRNGTTYTTGVILQFVTFYGPFWAICIVHIVAHIIVFVVIHRRVKNFQGTFDPAIEAQKKIWNEEVKPLLVFPWIYIVILIFPSMNRLRYAFGYDDSDTGANFFFWFMHSITLTLHGTVYAMVFACDRQTISRLRWSHMKAAMKRWMGEKGVSEYPMDASNPQFEELEESNYYELSVHKALQSKDNGTQYRRLEE